MNVLKVLMLVIKFATILKGHILAHALRVTPSRTTGHAKVGQYYWWKWSSNDLIVRQWADINECEEEIDKCVHICHNNNGSYYCSCNNGFIIDTDGYSCDGNFHSVLPYNNRSHVVVVLLDIDECSDGIHSCEQVCNNSHGTYNCLCFNGYELTSDNFTCHG